MFAIFRQTFSISGDTRKGVMVTLQIYLSTSDFGTFLELRGLQ